MKRYVIFGNTIVNAEDISKITIKPNFYNEIELILEIHIDIKERKSTKTHYTVVSRKDIEEKFGIWNETSWMQKGLCYDDAFSVAENDDCDNILRGIRKALQDDAILDAHEGDIFDYLDMCGVLDKYKDQYLSLIRKTTDEEFIKIQQKHELEIAINKLANTSEEDEERQRIYAGIKLLYKDLYRKLAPSIEKLIEEHRERESYRNFLRRLHDKK